jgi:hypothetical protein
MAEKRKHGLTGRKITDDAVGEFILKELQENECSKSALYKVTGARVKKEQMDRVLAKLQDDNQISSRKAQLTAGNTRMVWGLARHPEQIKARRKIRQKQARLRRLSIPIRKRSRHEEHTQLLHSILAAVGGRQFIGPGKRWLSMEPLRKVSRRVSRSVSG